MKIESIQNALTFVNEHAKVQFPRVDNSSLNILETPSSVQSPSQAASRSLLGILSNVIEKWDAAIRLQALLASILLAVYGAIILIGLRRVIYLWGKEEKGRGDGGGLSDLRNQGIAWVRDRVRGHPAHPFEDSRFQLEPGPTPSGHSKQ